MSKTVNVNDSNFDQMVLQCKTPVLVDFWAPWCRPCTLSAPILEELAREYGGKVLFCKVNVDKNAQYASKYGVMSIPNMIVFKEGKPVTQMVGYKPKPELKREIDAALG